MISVQAWRPPRRLPGEHARIDEIARDGESGELRKLIDAAITSFEMLQRGSVGVSGSTGGVLHHSLVAIRALVDRQSAEIAKPAAVAKLPSR